MIPNLGDTLTFIPTAYKTNDNGMVGVKDRNIQSTVKARVTAIHWKHGWYRVAWKPKFDREQHECIHFYP